MFCSRDSLVYLCQNLLAQAQENNAIFVAKTSMLSASPKQDCGFTVDLSSQGELLSLSCKYLINCAGLHSETVAHSIKGLDASLIPKLHLCRGHYFSYHGKSPFKQLIYPIPSDNGLGIHASCPTHKSTQRLPLLLLGVEPVTGLYLRQRGKVPCNLLSSG